MRIVVLVCTLLCSWGALATADEGHILLLVSQRNAETVAEAGRRFAAANPALQMQARSDVQWLELSASERQALLQQADVVLGVGLFGAVVNQLAADLQQTMPPTLLAFSSEHRLIGMSRLQGRALFRDKQQVETLAGLRPDADLVAWLNPLLQQYPQQQPWLEARSYWQAGGVDNCVQLLNWLARATGAKVMVQPLRPQPALRWWVQDQFTEQLPALDPTQPLLVILDHPGGDRPGDMALLRTLCSQSQGMQCLVGLASWGAASVTALEQLRAVKSQLAAIVMLQDFVLGGGDGREAATALLSELNVPLLKAIKLRDRSASQWQLSSDGMAVEKVYYQVAMPELQGASQPLVVATAGAVQTDPVSGIRIQPVAAAEDGIHTLLGRVQRWQRLQQLENKNKRIAIVYYNHPPGRHNIGADNLDVPESLWQILQSLQQAGYDTGTLPSSSAELLDAMQERGVNLPNDAAALKAMSPHIMRMSPQEYGRYFATLPETVQQEMRYGPFGLLQAQLQQALAAELPKLAQAKLDHTMEEMRHLLEGVDHKGRQRALDLLAQLRTLYQRTIDDPAKADWPQAAKIISALQRTGIEGLGGWGELPGRVMVYNNEILLPGLQFGNVFISPQPPRGWEINEELLHANLAFPPPHQYLAYYHYLRDVFKADAIVHVGRHSTYEFLPRRSVALAGDDYSRLVAADIPGVYPYIVDGVGEGIQAKRRGLAVMVDHLTPPLQSTPLYDELLQLRQLIESYEANSYEANRDSNKSLTGKLVQQIRERVEALELKEELTQSMAAELQVRGIGFNEVDDDLLVHEVGHYLTNLQERFMPLGLHVFGRDWKPAAVDMMLASMAAPDAAQLQQWKSLLQQSPANEMHALLGGLSGRFVAPGKGNDPIRSPDSLPTGRNFYALDNSLIPSRIAWNLGRKLAQEARANNPHNADKREAQVLWASDVVRDEGVMIAFALDMLGLEPVWNSRGLVQGLQRQTLSDGRERRDMVFTTSGLFRDLYGQQMQMLDRAVLMALDASADLIRQQHPALSASLQQALAPLGTLQKGGAETLQQNQVAAHWVRDARKLLGRGLTPEQVALLSTLRVFGDAPGSYGAGINRLVERSGAWQQRQELADVYLRRLGHGYNQQEFGVAAQGAFRDLLAEVENTYFGRSSNLYGLIDNNDAFDYLGGLSLAVETLTGTAPNNYVINHADPDNVLTQPLGLALRQELRGRFLNPQWLSGLMQHGYAGARTMGSEFLEYLWGWQVTNPTLVGDWAWQEVKEVYLDDRYGLGLNTFLEQGHNVHVKSNMLAIMLVAVHKGFWQADPATVQQLAQEFAQLVAANGLPGSGHTNPDNPMLPWLEQYLEPVQWQSLQQVITAARMEQPQQPEQHRLTEIQLKQADSQAAQQQSSAQPQAQAQDQTQANESASQTNAAPEWMQWSTWLLTMLLLAVLGAGFYRSWRSLPAPSQR